MDCEATIHDLLERMLHDAHLEPTQLPLSLLKAITNNFSDGQQIGSGGFAVVYTGLLRNGTSVAVKKLSQTFELDEKKFFQELDSLMRVKHKNIVRFLGYCADTQGKVCKWEGKNVMAEERQRLLCFEFMPKGSLDKYIKEMTQGLDWKTVYKIIKGICEGLHYLHENKIVHLDLKPANILLDDYMVPKIADFGISRCFDEKQTRAATSKVYGTLGYMAPELYNEEITITFKSDIYSLGTIVIEMLTGRKGYPDIDNVLTNWSTRFGNIPAGDPWLEHLKACVEMGIKCIDINPQRRPITQNIIDMLVDIEHTYGFKETDFCTSSAEHGLDVYPLDIWFPLESDKAIKCPVTLTNKTDDLIGVLVAPTRLDACSNPDYPYVWEEVQYGSSIFKRLGPHSSETIYMTMRKQAQSFSKKRKQVQLPLDDADKAMFDVVMVATKSEEDLEQLGRHWDYARQVNKSEDPLRGAEDLGTVVHRATLRGAITSDTARCQQVAAHQLIQAIPDEYMGCCIDVHPTKTWLIVGGDCPGKAPFVSIWNYETKVRVTKFEVRPDKIYRSHPPVILVKYIAEEQWFAAVDYIGGVHVYAYTSFGTVKHKVREFEAHDYSEEMSNLAVYPEHTLLLTASFHGKIKLWDWSRDWTCARVINTHQSLAGFNVGPSTFAIVAGGYNDIVVKVWNIHSPDAIGTFEGSGAYALYTNSHQDFLATLFSGGHLNAKIWDLRTKKHVHTLYPGILTDTCDGYFNLACHPTLPILAGIKTVKGSKVHQIVFWDVRTYRVMKWVELLMKGDYRKMVFDGMEDVTSLVVFYNKVISIIKINVSMLLYGC